MEGSLLSFGDRSKKLKAEMIDGAKKNKQQKYPRSIIKKGVELFSVEAFSYEDGSSEVCINTWVVRSIARKYGSQSSFGVRRICAESAPIYVNITQKIKGVTWTRQSKKVNDFGWSKSISEKYRIKFEQGYYLPKGIFTTVSAAIRYAVQQKELDIKTSIEWRDGETDPEEITFWNEVINDERKELKLLKTRQTKLKNAAIKAKEKKRGSLND